MMNAFGRTTTMNNNWLVEKIENAGLVYGEILNNELYIVADKVSVSVFNGKIYDYLSGKFVEKLIINTLVSETSKTYHVISNDIDECYCLVEGTLSSTKEPFKEYINMLPALESFDGVVLENDLTRQMFRLKTQSLMREVLQYKQDPTINVEESINTPFIRRNAFGDPNRLKRQNTGNMNIAINNYNVSSSTLETVDISKKNPLKEKIIAFQEVMKSYMKDKNIEDDEFMQNLFDDITVAINKFESRYLQMYLSARETSQGKEQTYNMTQIDEEGMSDETISRPMLCRSSTNSVYATPRVLNTIRTVSSQMN
jgi:hypothetical protein